MIQYSLAVERGNEKVAHLYTPYHPAVLQLIAMTANAAAENGILCGMCGEAAGNPKLISALCGMGLRELSMSPGMILRARRILCAKSIRECEEEADQLLAMESSWQIEEFLDEGSQMA